MLQRSAKSPFMPSTLVFPGGRRDDEDGPSDDDAAWVAAAIRECVEEADLRVEPARLRWFDTWLTPSAEPRRRYLARFFACELTTEHGTDARADGHETHDERWATVAEHLGAYEAGQIDLPPPTLSILLRLQAQPLARILDVDPRPPILPKFIFDDGRPTIVMPHDSDYPRVIGDGAPAPLDRLHDLPTRFVREADRWQPA